MDSYSNWLGQTVNVGDIVFNGQRDGNTSVYRFGRVKAFKWNGRKTEVLAQVEWIGEKGYQRDPNSDSITARRLGDRTWDTTASTLAADNLVVVDPSVVHTAKYVS